jgi:hypothetical protein
MPAFFEATQGFRHQYSDSLSFVGVAAAALWNMRWQVRGYRESRPDVTRSELVGRFVRGSTQTDANLVGFAEAPFEDQLEQLGRLQLFTAISLYERWLESLSFLTAADRKRLQYPRSSARAGTRDAEDVIRRVQRTAPPVMDDFRSVLQGDTYYSRSELNDLLIAYRLFKEVRNTFIHEGEMPGTNILASYAALTSLPTLPFGRSARGRSLPHVVSGQPVRITLDGAFSASTVILKMVMTLDADFALSTVGETEFLVRWQKYFPAPPWTRGSVQRQENRTKSLVGLTGTPKPNSAGRIQPYLAGKGLLRVLLFTESYVNDKAAA